MSAPPAPRRAPIAAVIGLIATCVAAFFVLMEPVETQRPRGPIGVARTDPSWAARQLLEARGVSTAVGYGLGSVPPTSEVIVVLGNGADAQRALVSRLEPWVRAGGHLVVFSAATDLGMLLASVQPADATELTLQDDGQQPQTPAPSVPSPEAAPADPPLPADADDTDLPGAPPVADPGDAPAQPSDEAPEAPPDPALAEPLLTAFGVEVHPAHGEAPRGDEALRVPNGPLLRLPMTDARSLSADRATIPWMATGPEHLRIPALRLRYGQGLVTAALDARPLLLPGLQSHPDGATLLWSYVSTADAPTAVRFVLQGGEGSLWAVLLERAPAAVVCALVAAAIALWRAQAWFGVPTPSAGGPRRGLMDHIDAVGSFFWLRVGGDALLGPLRRSALRQWERSVPGVSALPAAEAAALLAPRAGLPERTLTAALKDAPPDAAHLIAAVAALASLQRRGQRAG